MNPAIESVLVPLVIALALAVGVVLGARGFRRGIESDRTDRIRVSQVRDTFVVSGVLANDPHVVRELIRLYCIRRGLPPADLRAGGVPMRGENGEAVWPFRFQGSEVRG